MVDPDDETASYALDVIRSEKAMQLLDDLHEQRLTAPEQVVTITVEEAANRLAAGGEPHGRTPAGQISVMKDWLEDEWLDRMAKLHLIAYDEATGSIGATPATTLQWMIIRPGQEETCRDAEEIAAEAAWVAARIECSWSDP